MVIFVRKCQFRLKSAEFGENRQNRPIAHFRRKSAETNVVF